MTLDEVDELQRQMVANGSGSTAVGKYQFIGGTLREMRDKLGLKGTDLMTPDLQDRLARARLSERKYDRYLAGEITAAEFQRELAKEWRSLAAGPDDRVYRSPDRARISSNEVQRAIAEARQAEAVLNQMLDGGYAPPR